MEKRPFFGRYGGFPILVDESTLQSIVELYLWAAGDVNRREHPKKSDIYKNVKVGNLRISLIKL